MYVVVESMLCSLIIVLSAIIYNIYKKVFVTQYMYIAHVQRR